MMTKRASRLARRLSGTVLTLGAVCALAGAATTGTAGAATLTVVHGIPGFKADVYLDGRRTLSGFQAGTMTGLIHLKAGTYRLAIRPAGSAPTSTPTLTGRLTVTASDDVSVVGHLAPSGARVLTIYHNRIGGIPGGKSRVMFRQTAAVGPVDLLVDGRRVAHDIANPRQMVFDVKPGRHRVSVTRTGSKTAIWGPATVALRPGIGYLVYVIGSAKADTIDQLVQTVTGKADPPSKVQAGDGRLLEDVAAVPLLRSFVLPILESFLTPPDTGAVPAAASTAAATAATAATGDTTGGQADWQPHAARLPDRAATLAATPTAIAIPRLGLDAAITPTGLASDGSMALPASAGAVTWYRNGPSPGEAGSAVLAAHVDYGGRPGAFFALGRLVAGDEIDVTVAGHVRRFVVTGRRSYVKAALPEDIVFAGTGKPVLTLITCGGSFDSSIGHYDDNVVVYAVPAPPAV